MKIEIIKLAGLNPNYNISIRKPHGTTGKMILPIVLQTILEDTNEDVTLISSFTEDELRLLLDEITQKIDFPEKSKGVNPEHEQSKDVNPLEYPWEGV